jgi:hypothetical protein
MTAFALHAGAPLENRHCVSGALLLFLFVCGASAQQPRHCSSLLLSDLQPGLFAGRSTPVPDTASGDRISYGGSYFDVVQDRTSDNAGTISSVNSDAASAYAYATMQRTPWILRAWWNWSSMDFDWSNRASDLLAHAHSSLVAGGAGIGFKKGHVETEGALWVAPCTEDGDAPTRALGGSYSLTWKAHSFSVGLFADRSPALASLSNIETQSNGAGREFPLYCVRTRASLPFSFHFGPVDAGITPEVACVASDTTAQSPEKLNTLLNASGGTMMLWAKTSSHPLPVSFDCLLRDWSLGAKGYDGTTMYAIADNGEILDGWAEASVEFPHRIRAGAFGELSDGNVPQGYFEAFPFTSWTIFDPVHYKITRLSGVFHEAGLFTQGNFPFLHHFEIDPGIDCSFLYGKFLLGTRERQVAILIPYYTDESVISSEEKLVMVKLRLGYGLNFGRYSFLINALQLVPWELRSRQETVAQLPPSQPSTHTGYGGLQITFSGTLHF